MIRFIDCEYVAANPNVDTAFDFKRYTLSRTYFDEDETIEVRVRIPGENDNHLRFNRAIVFFDDAKESGRRSGDSEEDPNLAYNEAYTFIQRRAFEPKDSPEHKKEEDPVFWVHVLVPTTGENFHLETLTATKGENSWPIAPFAKEPSADDKTKSRGIQPSNTGASPAPAPGLLTDIKVRINIRERLARIDKPETPPLGSDG